MPTLISTKTSPSEFELKPGMTHLGHWVFGTAPFALVYVNSEKEPLAAARYDGDRVVFDAYKPSLRSE